MEGCRACGAADHPSGCAQDLPTVLFRCPDCHHRTDMHEHPYGCADCACDVSYWDADDEP